LKQVIALKILNDGQDWVEEQREAALHQSLTHEHIVQCFDYFFVDNRLHIATEFCGNGQLAKHKPTINETLLLAVIRDIASALEYLHGMNLIHFDVKPQNILISSIGEAKLADFGVSHHMDSTIAQSQCGKPGTLLYMAPEIVRGETATGAADVWALGITAFEMAVGVPIGLTDSATLNEWTTKHNPVFTSDQTPWSSGFTRMLRRMLTENPRKRITPGGILALPQISDLPPTWFLAGRMIDPDSTAFWEDS
jgi:serine/threonine protein kinase